MFAENDQEELDSQNQPLEEDVMPSTEEVDNTEDTEESSVEETTEGDQPQYTEHETKLYKRARKAEAEAKKALNELKALKQRQMPRNEAPSGSLTQSVREFKAVADLPLEDAEFVATYAEKFGISLIDARKNKDIQTILSVRAEERKTAEATATGATRRGTSKISDDKLLERAESGEMPDSDEDLRRLAASRLKARKT